VIGVLKITDGFYLYFDSENEIAVRIRKDDVSEFLEFCDKKEEISLEEICGGEWV